MSLDCDITGSKVVVEARNLLVKEMAVLDSMRSVDSWSVPPGLAPMQIFVV